MLRYYLDTGPLLDFLLLRYLADPGGLRLANVRVESRPTIAGMLTNPMRSDVSLRAHLERFMADFKPFHTTPGVVVEIHRHARELGKQSGGVDPRRFWSLAHDEFRNLGMKEHLVELTTMDVDRLPELGPVDESLLQLAKKDRNAVVVTSDEPFVARCRSQEVGVRWLDELRVLSPTA